MGRRGKIAAGTFGKFREKNKVARARKEANKVKVWAEYEKNGSPLSPPPADWTMPVWVDPRGDQEGEETDDDTGAVTSASASSDGLAVLSISAAFLTSVFVGN